MKTPTIILLKQINNPRRYTRWKLVKHTRYPKPLYCRRGETYHTQEQLEALAQRLGLRVVCKYNVG